MIKHFKTSTLKDYMSLAGELGMLEGKSRTDNVLAELWKKHGADTCVVYEEKLDGEVSWGVTNYNTALSEGKMVTVYTTDNVLPNDSIGNDKTNNDVKIYHVETQKDYDDLMIKLEEQGCRWRGGHLPTTQKKNWSKYKKSTYIAFYEDSKKLGVGSMSYVYSVYPEYPKNIIKHKAGDTLELEIDKAKEIQKYNEQIAKKKEELSNEHTQDNHKLFNEIITDLEQTYIAKNKDYGNSFEESLEEYGEVAGLVRIGDKFNRAKNLSENKANVTDESKIDTYLDMANYCIMQAMWLIKKEND